MKNAALIPVLLAAAAPAWGHYVYPAQGGSMAISYGGSAGQVSVTHFPDEDCQVTATAVEVVISTPLLTIQSSPQPSLNVFFTVTPARHPNGFSEESSIQLEWAATGINTSGQPEADCDGSGSALFNVVVSTALPMPTISNVAAPVNTPSDPVNIQNGEFFFEEKPDIYLGGPMPLAFNRYYASLLQASNTAPAPLGANWSHNFLFYMTPPSGGTATVVDNRGRILTFQQTATGFNLVSPLFAGYQLVSNDSGYTMGDLLGGRFYNFNSSGALTSIQDRNGNTHTLTWTGGNLTGISDGLGRTLTLSYDSNNHLTSVTDGLRTVSFAYALNNLASVTDVRGNTTQYAYDVFTTGFGQLTQKTTPLGNLMTQVYSASGQVMSQTDAVGDTTTFEYGSSTLQIDPLGHDQTYVFNSNGLLTSLTDENGKTSTYTYDTAGRRISATDSLGNVTQSAYDSASGNLVKFTQADGSVTTFTYASQTQSGIAFPVLTTVTFPDSTTQTMTYDANGNVISTVDRAGATTSATYNSRGQILTLTNPAGGVSTFTYGNNGTVSSVQDAAGNTTTIGYDTSFRANLITHPDGTTRAYTFDAAGNMLTDTDERGQKAQLIYDADNNLTSITDPLGNVTKLGYDAMDRLLSVTDPNGAMTSRTFDLIGRVATRRDRNGNTYTFGYDPASHLIGVTDPAGNVWKRSVDGEGFPVAHIDPLNNTWSYSRDSLARLVGSKSPDNATIGITYDSGGRISTFTDPASVETVFTPDPRDLIDGVSRGNGLVSNKFTRNGLALVTQTTDGNGQNWLNAYDSRGRMVSATSPLGAMTAFEYDNRNRVSQVTYPGNLGNLQVTYDAVGHIVGSAYSDGTKLTYTFDNASRLTAASGVTLSYDPVGQISSANGIAITRDAGGRITGMTLAPGKTLTYAYDARDLVTSVTDWAGGVTNISYDADSRPVSIARPNGTTAAFTYNSDSQLTGIQESGKTASSITVQRDGRGDVVSETKNLPMTPTLTPGVDPFSYDADSQVSGYTYDAMGRLTADTGRTYIWDLASRLTSYSDSSGTTAYTYDAFGRQTSQTRGGVTQNYIWNYALGQQVVSIVRQGGSDLRYYIHTPGGALLYSIEAAGNTRHFYHFDENGNTAYLTDDTGAVTDSYAYSPNGLPLGQNGTTQNPFTFGGQMGAMQQPANGLYYMRARYYDAASAHFLSLDPAPRAVDPNETNAYAYARQDPLLFVDPSGLDAEVNGDVVHDNHTDFTVDVWSGGQIIGTLNGSFGEGAYRTAKKHETENGSSGAIGLGTLVGGQGTFVIQFTPGQCVASDPSANTVKIGGTQEQDERAAQYILSSVDWASFGAPEYQAGTPAAAFLMARLKENRNENGEIRSVLKYDNVKGSGDWSSYGIVIPNRTCNTFTGTLLNIYLGRDAPTGVTAGSVTDNLNWKPPEPGPQLGWMIW